MHQKSKSYVAKFAGFSFRSKTIGAFKERVEPRVRPEYDIHAEKCPWHHRNNNDLSNPARSHR